MALLSIATLCAFGCWGIVVVVRGEAALATSAKVTMRSLGSAAAGLTKTTADADVLIADSKPRIEMALTGADGAIAQLEASAAGLNQAVAELNAPCAEGKPCGTLADVNRTLASFRLAAGQVTAVSEKEQSKLDEANRQETAVAQSTQADLAKLGSAIDNLGALAANDDLKKSLANLNTTTGAVSGMATDTAQYWHDFLHPKWPKRVWNGVTGIGIAAAKFFVP